MVNITLLSDFGLHDASASAVKGTLLTNIPDARITDISHEISPFDVTQGAYVLGSAYRHFPVGTVHIVLIDVYYGTLPKLVLAGINGHYFLAPDNGILPLAIGDQALNSWLCFELTKDQSFGAWIKAAAETIRALQSSGSTGLKAHTLYATATAATADLLNNEVACAVQYIDNFGNVVTDMTREHFDSRNKTGRFQVNFMRVNVITGISRNYSDVQAGDNLCRFNRNGYLEICVNQGSASSLFGFRARGKHNDIKITFE
jgi:S-adenosyl-L-methionine hydrolase (adenosine-forming)